MKKNYQRLIPLLLVLPALMGNSPRPQVFDHSYKDYKISYVNEEQVGERYHYTYHFKNTGNGYVSRIELSRTLGQYTSMSYSPSNQFYPFLYSVLPPDYEADITFDHYEKVNNPSKLSKLCEAYATFDNEVEIWSTREVTFVRSDYDTFYYKIDISLDNKDKEYYYGAILKLNYDGTTYYVKIDETYDYSINSKAELDLSKLVVEDITVIKSRGAYYGCVDAFQKVLTLLLICFFVMISMGIFAAIFIPAMVRRKRRKRQVNGLK